MKFGKVYYRQFLGGSFLSYWFQFKSYTSVAQYTCGHGCVCVHRDTVLVCQHSLHVLGTCQGDSCDAPHTFSVETDISECS